MLVREMPLGKGFCDIAFLPKAGNYNPAIRIELKWDKSVKTAID